MGNYGDDDFREKPSWRDMDRRRDRSRHVSHDGMGSEGSSRWVRKQVLREAERLFQSKPKKKMNPEQAKALNDIHSSCGTKKFAPSVRRYLKTYGLPEDWSTLMLLLDFNVPATVMEAIESLKKLYPQQGLEEQQGYRSKLNILAMTAKDDELRFFAEQTSAEV